MITINFNIYDWNIFAYNQLELLIQIIKIQKKKSLAVISKYYFRKSSTLEGFQWIVTNFE